MLVSDNAKTTYSILTYILMMRVAKKFMTTRNVVLTLSMEAKVRMLLDFPVAIRALVPIPSTTRLVS